MFFLVVAIAVVGMIANARVNSVYKKYAKVRAKIGLPAHDVAQRLLYAGGSDAQLTEVGGRLTDHYDPRSNVVGLSQAVYNDASVAALAVAAHEIGHVMQYQEAYGPIKLRNALLPVAKIGSAAAPWIVIAGVLMGSFGLASFGAWLFAGILLFQLVTLPVEFNASRRALDMLTAGGYIDTYDEEAAARKVLNAAATTYVVAALASFVSFLRLLMIANSARRR
ncbi:MAG TPA: zinc metallopeptidase [Clostridia bacterium]|nr:zinc metallopeptidase [Clostridia bacterium]